MAWIIIQPLIGGMGIGAAEALGSAPDAVVSYSDIPNDELYCGYLSKTGSEVPHIKLDIAHKDIYEGGNAEFDAICGKDTDYVVAVPICSGISGANSVANYLKWKGLETKGDVRGEDSPCNDNMLSISRLAMGNIKPKIFMFENAYAITSEKFTGLRRKIDGIASDYGYTPQYVNVDTKNYGIPQSRKRCFIIFVRNDIREARGGMPLFDYINYTEGTIDDFYMKYKGDYGQCEHDAETCRPDIHPDYYIKWCEERGHSLLEYCEGYTTIEKAMLARGDYDGYIEWLESLRDAVADKELHFLGRNIHYSKIIREKGGYYNEYNILMRTKDLCANTVYYTNLVHMYNTAEDRYVTKRDAMRLMGMPEDFASPSQSQLIGRNVPVCTAKHWCGELRKYLESPSEMRLSNDASEYYMQKVQAPAKRK